MHGPGPYDEEATAVRESSDAIGVVLMVFGGNRGTGFAAQLPGSLLMTLPGYLRDLADQIEQDAAKARH